MSFRDRMKVSPSNAEISVRVEIAKRQGLAKKLLMSLGTVVIFDSHKGKPYVRVAAAERVTKTSLQRGDERLPFTRPDFLFCSAHGQLLPVYLDGQPHEKAGVMNRDEKINQLWGQCDIIPLRFRYRAPMSKQQEKEIVDEIEEQLVKWQK